MYLKCFKNDLKKSHFWSQKFFFSKILISEISIQWSTMMKKVITWHSQARRKFSRHVKIVMWVFKTSPRSGLSNARRIMVVRHIEKKRHPLFWRIQINGHLRHLFNFTCLSGIAPCWGTPRHWFPDISWDSGTVIKVKTHTFTSTSSTWIYMFLEFPWVRVFFTLLLAHPTSLKSIKSRKIKETFEPFFSLPCSSIHFLWLQRLQFATSALNLFVSDRPPILKEVPYNRWPIGDERVK